MKTFLVAIIVVLAMCPSADGQRSSAHPAVIGPEFMGSLASEDRRVMWFRCYSYMEAYMIVTAYEPGGIWARRWLCMGTEIREEGAVFTCCVTWIQGDWDEVLFTPSGRTAEVFDAYVGRAIKEEKQ